MTIDDAILKLIEAIQKLAPEVWAVLIKQVYSEAATYLVWGVIWLIAAALCGKATLAVAANNWGDDWHDDSIRYFCAGLLALTVIGLLVIAANDLTAAAQWFYNPEFYAIRFLLQQIPGK